MLIVSNQICRRKRKDISIVRDVLLSILFCRWNQMIHSGLFQEDQELLPFVVRLTRNGVKRCKSDPWLSNSIRADSDGGGFVVSKISPPFISWAVDYFISFGTDALVEQPDVLVLKIKEQILELRNHYKS